MKKRKIEQIDKKIQSAKLIGQKCETRIIEQTEKEKQKSFNM